MGARGPNPTPTAILEARGSWRAKARADEPRPTPGAPTMPRWLGKEAKAEWKRIVPELLRLGVLTKIDRAALAAYCQAHAELVEATKILEAEGRIVQTPVFNRAGELTGQVSRLHPAVKLQRDAFGRVKAFLAEFGLTPSSRGRLHAPGEPEKEETSKSRFFRTSR